jgi:hypothetical protein
MNHSDIDVIRLKTSQQILKSPDNLANIPCPYILPVSPCRTQMPLYNDFTASAAQGPAYPGPNLRVCNKQVKGIHAILQGNIKEFTCERIVLLHKRLAA